jgi:DnaJ-class molecular chaperone
MTKLKRYELEFGCGDAWMQKAEEGAYVRYDDIKHLLQAEPKCPRCDGTGMREPCLYCDGTGVEKKS